MTPLKSDYKKFIRWLSIIPSAFTTLILTDWIIRLAIWWIVLPFTLLEKLFKYKTIGPIGKIFDKIFNYLIGVDSITAMTIVFTGFFTGYIILYISSILSPSDTRKTAKILAPLYIILVCIATCFIIINHGILGEDILLQVCFIIGINSGVNDIKAQSTSYLNKYEKFILRNIFPVFITTSLFTTILILLFMY